MLVVMRSASKSVLIGPILIEHEPSYDEVVVEGRESLSMKKPRHFTSQAQKSNASGDHEIHNDNGSDSFPKTHHWIRNSIGES